MKREAIFYPGGDAAILCTVEIDDHGKLIHIATANGHVTRVDMSVAAVDAWKGNNRRAGIDAAIRKLHTDRGCCDGTFAEPCPWKATRAVDLAKQESELERLDFIAFQNAELMP